MPLNLLAMKFHRPVLPARLLMRSSLIQRMNDGLEAGCQLTLVSAPAGFGKSTCVSEWVSGLKIPVAWLSLDASDNDPARFFAYFTAALRKVDPDLGKDVHFLEEAILQPGQLPPLAPQLMLLLNDIERFGGRILLVLDDFQGVKDPGVLKVVELLLANQPRNLHLALITREDPHLPLARLRANHQMTEVRAADLRLSLLETDQFLNGLSGLSLSPADVRVLEDRTEGWMVGLQLAALSMRNQADRSAYIARLSGNHRHILSYLTEEVLSHQTGPVQTFLLQTSILDRLSADLCDAVTAQPGSQALLEGLLSSNLFLIPLDDEGLWFRYHHLFGDLLQAQLRRLTSSETIQELHKRAAEWFGEKGVPEEAVRHALAAGEFETAADLVELHTPALLTRGELATLLSWMDQLPSSLVRQRPRLLLTKVWVLLFAGALDQIEQLLQDAEARYQPEDASPEAREIRGVAAAVRAFFMLMAGDLTQALELAARAEALLPDASLTAFGSNLIAVAAHSVAPYTQGMAYRARGEYEKAAEAFTREIQTATSPQTLLIWAIATTEVAAVRRLQGRLHEAAGISRRAAQRVAGLNVLPVGPLARLDASLGEVLREQGELAEAHRLVTGALERARHWEMPTDLLAFHLTLLRIQLSLSDLAAAQSTLSRAKELRSGQPVFFDLSRDLDLLEIRLALKAKDLGAAETLLDRLQPGSSPVVFLRERELVLLARLRLAQGNPAGAVAVLSPLAAEAESEGRGYAFLEASSLLSLALQAGPPPERDAALPLLLKALAIARPEGFVRVFVDEGPAMRSLLLAARAQIEKSVPPSSGPLAAYISKLLDAFARDVVSETDLASHETAASLVEPLTGREQEVLCLIAAGLKYGEIAARLYISVNTVRTYVKAIYSKLGANSRHQAVLEARKNKIIA